MVANLDYSDLRFTFDFDFKIKEILKSEEMVKFTVEGVPKNECSDEQLFSRMGVCESSVSKLT
jgi:hypothetical protein